MAVSTTLDPYYISYHILNILPTEKLCSNIMTVHFHRWHLWVWYKLG